MGIVDWFNNDLDTDERTLTRDLLSVAIADKEFNEEEKNAILKTCQLENVSMVELMDSIRDKTAGATLTLSIEEKKRYLLHLVRMMSADGNYHSLELNVIGIVAKKLDVTPILLLSFVLDEIKDNNISKVEGITILDCFVKHFITEGI